MNLIFFSLSFTCKCVDSSFSNKTWNWFSFQMRKMIFFKHSVITLLFITDMFTLINVFPISFRFLSLRNHLFVRCNNKNTVNKAFCLLKKGILAKRFLQCLLSIFRGTDYSLCFWFSLIRFRSIANRQSNHVILWSCDYSTFILFLKVSFKIIQKYR